VFQFVPFRRALVALGCAGIVLAALLVPAGPASALTAHHPRAPRAYSARIEDPTSYVGQTSCDPVVRRGTAKLAALLVHTYPGTTWASAYRCGTDGSQSEHYEGRAIDWMVSARNPQQLADAQSFYRWLLATDRFGNRFAMARRLGVMYLIFRNRMWGSWDGRWHEYNNCWSKKEAGPAYANACHRTHMHISLSWNGARAHTTFWTGTVYRTDYGPCRVKGHKYAPDWTHVNLTPCPGTWG
jgi:hypothetical protein